jgi:hypothetical protein
LDKISKNIIMCIRWQYLYLFIFCCEDLISLPKLLSWDPCSYYLSLPFVYFLQPSAAHSLNWQNRYCCLPTESLELNTQIETKWLPIPMASLLYWHRLLGMMGLKVSS